MSLPLHLAEKLLFLCEGEAMAGSKLKHEVVRSLIDDGIIIEYRQGRTKTNLSLPHPQQLYDFLHNHYGIGSLKEYIDTCKKVDNTRADLVLASSDSKIRQVRTFKGFLVNTYQPVSATLNGKPIIINPTEGTYTFISDFESFVPAPEVTIVGIENPENFRHIASQQYLFEGLSPLFVSRYPQSQSKDHISWLQSITNPYLHFGDYDYAGIGIYLNEYRKYLGERASILIPENLESLLAQYGNRERYDIQKRNFDRKAITEPELLKLIALLDIHKKGLDQEVFVGRG